MPRWRWRSRPDRPWRRRRRHGQAGRRTQKPAPPATQKPADAAPAAQPPAAPKPFPEGAKIAYIDLQFIASNSSEGKAATAKIQEFTKKKTAELEGKQKALEAVRNKLLQGGTVLSDSARGQMEKDIDKMARELQFAQQEAQPEQQALTHRPAERVSRPVSIRSSTRWRTRRACTTC